MPFDYHPDLHPMLQRAASFPTDFPDTSAKRAAWHEFCTAINPPKPSGMQVSDHQFSRDDYTLPFRMYRPSAATVLPLVLYIRGGGWVVGDLDTNDGISYGLAAGTGAAVISISYRQAPEHRYPAAFHDCYAALLHVIDHSQSLGIDPARLTLCGDSAGGNLAAALSLASRERHGPSIAAQALVYPVLDQNTERPSYLENADAPGLTRADMLYYLDAYLGPKPRQVDAYALPMLATDLSGLPPTLVHTAQYDPLRDEGAQFAERLQAANVPVVYRCAPRMTHSFLRARTDGPAPAAEFDFLTRFLRRYLNP